jgi:hypothetical protein
MIVRPKIDYKKIKANEEGTKFGAIADAYVEWMEGLRGFHKFSHAEQTEFLEVFGKDMNALLLILYEYANPRTDDVSDRGNQVD